ncbi:hypothetical protein [Rheinheimera sp. UJ63]|uniref:hypothetical protein n=1 Tax=Rheinheimera sp. UJ63 TaxID=2910157 RepID=UPI001F34AD22|nr:hypothetical protein [Rheinheimera sp. UJ63]MCF4010366.1 hypothetical protein [Rheinheimera sp. UJ63]
MRHFIVFLFLALLAGCGGGGSDSNTGSGTGSGGNNTGSNSLTITADNALYLAAITSLSNDTLTSFAQLAVLAHDELNNKPRALALTRPVFCQNGSQASALVKQTVSDTYYLGANQRFNIVFNQCQLPQLSALVNGELEVEISTVTLDGYSLEISAAQYRLIGRNLRLTDEEGSIQVALDVNSRYSANQQQYTHALTPALGSNLTLTLPDNKREQFSGFNTQLILSNQTGRYQLSTQGRMQSETLAGTVAVSTISPLTGRLQRLPNGGEWLFQGSGNSTLRLSALSSEPGKVAKVSLPALAVEGEIDWLDLSTGAAWQKTGLAKNYTWREQRDFVNLEQEWQVTGQSVVAELLPEQPLYLHFSNDVHSLGGYGSTLTLIAVDENNNTLFGIPAIEVEISLQGTIVKLQPLSAMLAGFRYRLGSMFGRNEASSNLASTPYFFATLKEELAATLNVDTVLFRSGQTVDITPSIQSLLGQASVTWQTDNTVVAKRALADQGISLTFATAPAGGFLRGSLTLQLSNARGNQLLLERPYVVIDEQLENYFFNSVEPLSGVGVASALLAPINANQDIGNDTGIYTGVSGFYTDTPGDTAQSKHWSLWLRTGGGGILQPGTYTSGAESDFAAPHIMVNVEKRTCDTESATFTVEQAQYDADNIFVTALRANYDLVCTSNGQRYKYQGQIRYQRRF